MTLGLIWCQVKAPYLFTLASGMQQHCHLPPEALHLPLIHIQQWQELHCYWLAPKRALPHLQICEMVVCSE